MFTVGDSDFLLHTSDLDDDDVDDDACYEDKVFGHCTSATLTSPTKHGMKRVPTTPTLDTTPQRAHFPRQTSAGDAADLVPEPDGAFVVAQKPPPVGAWTAFLGDM